MSLIGSDVFTIHGAIALPCCWLLLRRPVDKSKTVPLCSISPEFGNPLTQNKETFFPQTPYLASTPGHTVVGELINVKQVDWHKVGVWQMSQTNSQSFECPSG